MKIALGSKSDKKYNAVVSALKELKINDYKIDCYKVNSMVSDNPINDEALIGAKNRNNNLLGIDNSYDMYISIEAGFSEVEDNCYVDTYCVIRYKDNDYIGMSPRLKITKKVFDYVKSGNVLHLLVQELQGSNTDDGVVGYLSSGKLTRARVEEDAVLDALVKALKLDYKLNNINIDEYLDSNQIKKLDNAIDNKEN